MKLTILLIAPLLAASLFAAGEYSNRRAPGFSLYDSHFVQHDPQDYRGKPVIVDFMLTTCPVCNKLADTLVNVKAKYGDKIAVLSIMTAPDNYQTADQFAVTHKITWPMLLDSGQVMMSYLKVSPAHPDVHFPHLFLIDGSGMIRNDFEGTEDKFLTVEGLSKEIDKLLNPTKGA
jgi:peroxiredoxin